MDSAEISYAQSPAAEPYMYCTIPSRLSFYATEFPEKAAFIIHSISGDRAVVTCKDVYEQSMAFAKGLIHLGIKKGDTVAVSFPNSREWLISTFGIQMAGGIPLHMQHKYKDGRDIIPVLQVAGNCKAIIMDSGHEDSETELLKHIVTDFAAEGGKTEVRSTCLPYLKFVVCDNNRKQNKAYISMSDILNFGTIQKDGTNLPDLDPDDFAAFLLTSGSTGLPKLVPKTHFQMLEFGQGFISAYDIKSKDVYFNDRLFSWGAGYPTVFLTSGITHVTSSDQFTLKSIKDICDFAVKIIKSENCTVSQFLPAFVIEMLSRNENEAGCHQRLIVSSGVPIPEKCSEVVGRFSDEFACLYGSTEMSCVSVKKVTRSSDYFNYCVGRPLPGVEMKIVDKSGKIVLRNQTGELYVRHQSSFSGYHKNPTKTNEVMGTDGWYRTDDSAFMDNNGDFIVTGRCSDIILCYGESVFPSLIENEIKQHPAVSEICVVPVNDPICFQKVCICVVSRKEFSLKEEDLKDFLSTSKTGKTSFTEQSRVYLFFESFPKTAVGKIFRKGVREEAERRLNGQEV